MPSRLEINIPQAPIQKLESPLLQKKKIQIAILREDLNHPLISGNKYRKLKYNLLRANELGHNTLLSFGGAYSNHIHATAAAGKAFGFNTIGVIRGEELATKPKNATLADAQKMGMQLDFVTRQEYREKETSEFIEKLHQKWGDFYYIPEGGTNNLAVKGCQEIQYPATYEYTYLACAMGTAGTISGIIKSTKEHQKVLGFPALRGGDFLLKTIEKYTDKKNFEIINDYHFGGYGKINQDLISFVNNFKKEFQIPIDPIYVGKMLYGIWELVNNNFFEPHSQILVVHSGGLQGIRGMNEKTQKIN